MSENERTEMMVLVDTIKGEINRMCVTKELAEFDAIHGRAQVNIDQLATMIYNARFKVESEDEELEFVQPHKKIKVNLKLV